MERCKRIKQSSSTRGQNQPQAPRNQKTILVVEHHPVTRSGIVSLINKQPELYVCCQAGNVEEGLQQLNDCKPDLMITGIIMPGNHAMAFLHSCLTRIPSLKILVFSIHDEELYAEKAIRVGARGYIMKDAAEEELLVAIRRVLAGQIHVSDKISARVLSSAAAKIPRGSRSPISQLSDREFEIFELTGHGKNTREIAHELNISPKTVDIHRLHIKTKLGVDTIAALVRQAALWVEIEPAIASTVPAHDPLSSDSAKPIL